MDDLIWYSLGSIQYMQLDSLAWSVTNKHIHDIFLKWHVSAILIFWSYYAVSTLTIILKTFYAISRQLIIYRDKSSLLLQSSSRRLPGVFLWLLGDWWLQDLLESAAEATRPPCSAGVGMLAGWACPTRRSSRVDWSAARLPAWVWLVRRVSRDGKQSSLHSNTAPRSVQSVWRRRLLENKIFFNIQSSFTHSRHDFEKWRIERIQKLDFESNVVRWERRCWLATCSIIPNENGWSKWFSIQVHCETWKKVINKTMVRVE